MTTQKATPTTLTRSLASSASSSASSSPHIRHHSITDSPHYRHAPKHAVIVHFQHKPPHTCLNIHPHTLTQTHTHTHMHTLTDLSPPPPSPLPRPHCHDTVDDGGGDDDDDNDDEGVEEEEPHKNTKPVDIEIEFDIDSDIIDLTNTHSQNNDNFKNKGPHNPNPNNMLFFSRPPKASTNHIETHSRIGIDVNASNTTTNTTKHTSALINTCSISPSTTVVPHSHTSSLSSFFVFISSVLSSIFSLRTLLSFSMFVMGILLVIQTGMNGRAANVLGHGLRGSCISFAIGSIALFTLILFLPTHRSRLPNVYLHRYTVRTALDKDLLKSEGFAPWWCWTGGAIGAIYVTIAIIVSQAIGFALYFVACVAGQVICALSLDATAILGVQKRELTWIKICGGLLAVGGCVMLIDFGSSITSSSLSYYFILGLFGGFIQPLQAAVNKGFTRLVKSPLVVSLYCFVTGFILIVIVNCLTLISIPLVWKSSLVTWWMFFPGIIGVSLVVSGIVVAPRIGLATFFVCVVAGQLAMSTITDVYGIFGNVRSYSGTPVAICGAVIAFIGATIIANENACIDRRCAQQLQQASNNLPSETKSPAVPASNSKSHIDKPGHRQKPFVPMLTLSELHNPLASVHEAKSPTSPCT